MKTKRLTWVASISMLLLAGFSQAQATEIWSPKTRLTHVYPAAEGMYFNTVYVNTSLSACDSGTRWFISTATPNYQAMVASLLTAFSTGKEVALCITVNPPQCGAVVNRFVVYEQ